MAARIRAQHQRTRPKEIPPLEVRRHSLPVLVLASGDLHIEPLQAFVEAANCFLLLPTTSAITVQLKFHGLALSCVRDVFPRLPGGDAIRV